MKDRKSEIRADLAARLREAVETANVTRRYIADSLGVSHQAVSKWLSSGVIAADKLQGFAELLLFSEEWLRTGHGAQRLGDPSLKPLPAQAQIALDLWRSLTPGRQRDMVRIMRCLRDAKGEPLELDMGEQEQPKRPRSSTQGTPRRARQG